jgi:hypothetical protein
MHENYRRYLQFKAYPGLAWLQSVKDTAEPAFRVSAEGENQNSWAKRVVEKSGSARRGRLFSPVFFAFLAARFKSP